MKKTLASLAAAGMIAAGGVFATAPVPWDAGQPPTAAQAAVCTSSAWPIQYDYRYVKQNWVGYYYRDSPMGNCRHQAIWEVGLEYKSCRVLRQYYQVKNNHSRGYIHYRCPKGEYWRYSEWARM